MVIYRVLFMLTMRTLIVVGVPLEDAKGGLGPFLWKVVYQVLNNEDVKRDLESYSVMLGCAHCRVFSVGVIPM
jgi:hypothetical protein